MYASYRLLNGLQVSSAQTEAIERDIIVFDVTKMMAALEAG